MSSNFLVVQASAAQTTGGVSAAFNNPGLPLQLALSVTAGSGTVTVFAVSMQGSPDNGATWFDMPFEYILKSGLASPGNSTQNTRDLVNETTRITSAQYFGRLLSSMGYMRAKWNVDGTSPSETFAIVALGLG